MLPFADLATPLPAGLTQTGTTLTWAIPQVAPGATRDRQLHRHRARGRVRRARAQPGHADQPGGTCTTAANCETDHPTPPPWTLAKTANPPSGTVGQPGRRRSPTRSPPRTPARTRSTGATADDDLSAVLPFADLGHRYQRGPDPDRHHADLGDPAGRPRRERERELRGDRACRRVRRARAQPGHYRPAPAATCTTPADCVTDHPTPPPWTLAKTANPPSGTQVNPGATITYTLTATNTGTNPLTGATAEDDLAAVLPFADLGSLPAGLTLTGTTLTWAIPHPGRWPDRDRHVLGAGQAECVRHHGAQPGDADEPRRGLHGQLRNRPPDAAAMDPEQDGGPGGRLHRPAGVDRSRTRSPRRTSPSVRCSAPPPRTT